MKARIGGDARYATYEIQLRRNRTMAIELGKDHYFAVFRMGMDECAKCGKPRSEHPRAPR